MHRECVTLAGSTADISRHLVGLRWSTQGATQGLGGRGPKARGPLRCCLRACWASACLRVRGFGHAQTGKKVKDDSGKARENQLRATPCVRARGACVTSMHACTHAQSSGERAHPED